MNKTIQHIRFGNGTTALWAALKSLGCHDIFVAVPSTICPSIICAIFASENRPYFVDIEQRRFGLDPALLPSVLPHVGAVIAVHAFGIPCEIATISDLCRNARIPLIEDCCQAQGAQFEGRPTGQFGDVAIFSYGTGKIIEAGGGGALETSNEYLGKKARVLAEALLKVDEQAVKDLGLFYKFFYNQFYPNRLQYYQLVFTLLLQEIGQKLLGQYPDLLDSAIGDGFANLANNIHSRKEKSALYARLLENVPGLHLLDFPEGSTPWRFNIHLEFPARQFILKQMLEERRAVSSWSPDISQFMDSTSYKATSLVNSKWLGEGILNLWVNDDTDERQIVGTCNKIKSLLAEFRENHPDNL